MSRPPNTPDADLVESLFAARVTAALGERAAELPRDIAERLRVAREQAVGRARPARAPAAAPARWGGGGRAALLGGGSSWWVGLGSALPLLLLVAGLFLVDEWTSRAEMLAAAEVDAVLLADDLPPAAYSDPGFGEFLKTPLP